LCRGGTEKRLETPRGRESKDYKKQPKHGYGDRVGGGMGKNRRGVKTTSRRPEMGSTFIKRKKGSKMKKKVWGKPERGKKITKGAWFSRKKPSSLGGEGKKKGG